MSIAFVIPGTSPSASNLREHYMARAARTKAQRGKALLLCPKWSSGPLLVVTLTRVAPRELDSDNLANSMKAYRDGVASRLGVDDRTPLVRWEYRQATCKAGEECVRVLVDDCPF